MNPQQKVDVIIIGSGSIGTPAAMYMAEAGLKTLVIDQFASSGKGANKAAIGGVRATHSDPAKIQLGLRSLEVFRTWQECHGDDIEWHSGGYCFLAFGEQQEKTLKALLVTQKTFGLNIDWHDAEGILKLAPDVNPDGLRGGTFSPEDGYCSNLRANHAFYRRAVNLGAEFRFGETVTAILQRQNKVTGVQTNQGTYHAPIVVNAAGPWAAAIGAMLGFDHPVTPDSHEAGITEPVERFLEPLLIDIQPGPGSANIYFYQQMTGQFNFCLTPEPQIWGYDCQETSNFLPQVSRRVIRVVPRMANIRVRRTWRGLYPMTPDGFPLIGWAKEMEGYLMAIGMCGQGFMLGPGVGNLLSRLITEESRSADDQRILDQLSPYREFKGKEALK